MSDRSVRPQAGTQGPTYSPVPIPDLAQRAAMLGQLSGGILHEFNNILTVISGTIDILAQAVSDRPELAAITRLIDEAALRGGRMTAHLIAFERGQPPQYRAVDVSALLSDAIRLLRPVLGNQVEIALLSPADPITAVADPSLLLAGVLKLAIAARDVMPDGGRISVAAAAAAAGSSVAVAVEEIVEIRVDAVDFALADSSLVWGAPELEPIEELVRLCGGEIAVERQPDRVECEIRLRKADTAG